ncbi:hypothetical protein P3S68_014844 [Capsicum galapagoense]
MGKFPLQKLMASKTGSTPATYSPSPATHKKKRIPIADWVCPDNRGFYQCRPAYLRTGAVTTAAGSAYAEFGNTKVIVSVFGPRESKKAMMYSDTGRLNCDVDVFAVVLESGGSDLPVVISCASLALADAGILLYDLFASVSVSCLGKDLVIDSISEEESYNDGSLMITCMPLRNQVTQLIVDGEWSTPKIHDVMELCLGACSKLGEVMRSCLKDVVTDLKE